MLTGIWAFGNFDKRPLTFKNTNIIINWSIYNLKLEIYGKSDDLDMVLEFYDGFSQYGEWGEEFVKPIVWMSINNDKEEIRSKKFIDIKNILIFLKYKEKFKITIYFETILNYSPLENNYTTSNSYWINCLGGLYYIVDLCLYVEKNNETFEGELYLNNGLHVVKDYRYEDFKKYALETAETAKDLVKNKEGYSFKTNIII